MSFFTLLVRTCVADPFRDSAVPRTVAAWRAELPKKIAASIASPETNADLFEEDWQASLAREEELYGPPETAVNGAS